MRNTIIMIIVIYLTINITILVMSSDFVNKLINKPPQLAGTLNVTKSEIQTKIITEKKFYVPVSKFTSLPTTTSIEALRKGKVFSLVENKLVLPLTFENVFLIKPEEMNSYIDQGYTGLLQPEQVNSQLKTLTVEGQNFWTKSFISDNYPLYFSISKKVPFDQLVTDNVGIRETIFVGGEIITARAVDRLSLNKNNNYTYMYDFFAPEIKSADLAIAMLENPMNGNPSPCTGCMVFVGDDRNIKGLKDVGFDMFSTAGNHAGDGLQKGYENTINLLKTEGIPFTGTGNTDEAKIAPAIYKMNGRTIGMVAADTVSSYYWSKGSKSFGTNWFSNNMNGNIDMDRVKQISKIKTDNSIDYLIVYMSWGVEYTNKAIKFQEDLAHALIDNGADLIVASHPHWVQNIEFYKGKPIFYALGNFLFDQNHTDPTREGVILNLHYFNHELKAIDIEPHISCGPYITSKDVTNDYLAGKVSMSSLQTGNEKNGCVYFQPKKLIETDSRYKEVMDRLFQHTNVNLAQ